MGVDLQYMNSNKDNVLISCRCAYTCICTVYKCIIIPMSNVSDLNRGSVLEEVFNKWRVNLECKGVMNTKCEVNRSPTRISQHIHSTLIVSPHIEANINMFTRSYLEISLT